MSSPTNIHLYASSSSIRIFWGYKLNSVTQEQFHKDLGETFMPGTPAVLGPVGLNGYLPAVLNLQSPEKYPDEVALIVYPTLELYESARRGNLLGRIYTFSHAGVFDMSRSGGQWPGTIDKPNKHATLERWAWRVFDQPLDWQRGSLRLLTLETKESNLFDHLTEFTRTTKTKLKENGVDEIVVQCTRQLATVWIYSLDSDLKFNLAELGIVNQNVTILNDLFAEPFHMRGGVETLTISGEKFIQFRFPRNTNFYV